jgi:hypothetical protein
VKVVTRCLQFSAQRIPSIKNSRYCCCSKCVVEPVAFLLRCLIGHSLPIVSMMVGVCLLHDSRFLRWIMIELVLSHYRMAAAEHILCGSGLSIFLQVSVCFV